MRNTSTNSEEPRRIVRATFEVPTPLYRAFAGLCAEQDVTLSQALRRFMRESLEEREAA